MVVRRQGVLQEVLAEPRGPAAQGAIPATLEPPAFANGQCADAFPTRVRSGSSYAHLSSPGSATAPMHPTSSRPPRRPCGTRKRPSSPTDMTKRPMSARSSVETPLPRVSLTPAHLVHTVDSPLPQRATSKSTWRPWLAQVAQARVARVAREVLSTAGAFWSHAHRTASFGSARAISSAW